VWQKIGLTRHITPPTALRGILVVNAVPGNEWGWECPEPVWFLPGGGCRSL